MPHSPLRATVLPIRTSAAWHAGAGLGPQAQGERETSSAIPSDWPQPAAHADCGVRHSQCACDAHSANACPFERPRHVVVASASALSGTMPPVLQLLRLRGHCADCVFADSCQQMLAALNRCQTQVLVLDLDLIKAAPMAEMLQLRHQFPEMRWILACHSAAPPCADLVLKFQARGLLNLDDVDSIGRAIDAVLAGDLWFPRRLTDEFYVRLLSKLHDMHAAAAPVEVPAAGALTRRETETLALTGQGMTNKEIARRLSVSINTVKKHLKNAFEKRGLNSRRQALF
jgi:DNA-binding NarL/FixJ family response regulator